MLKPTPARDRFWPKVDRSAGPDACWPWLARVTKNGYGQFRDDNRMSTSAHRVAYRLTHGFIAPDLVVDHLCRNRACCNPAHLEAVTHDENMRRARRPTCFRGHPMIGDNVVSSTGGGKKRRECRICLVARRRHAVSSG